MKDSPTRRRQSIRLGLVLLVAAGVSLGCDRLTGEVTGLKVGDCFDKPTDANATVTDVQHQPCSDPHDAEVIAVVVHDAPPSAGFPVVSGFSDFIQEKCVPVFATYIGRDFDTDTVFDLGYFQPTLTGWAGGDRGFTCYVSRSDAAKLTSSVRVGGATPTP